MVWAAGAAGTGLSAVVSLADGCDRAVGRQPTTKNRQAKRKYSGVALAEVMVITSLIGEEIPGAGGPGKSILQTEAVKLANDPLLPDTVLPCLTDWYSGQASRSTRPWLVGVRG